MKVKGFKIWRNSRANRHHARGIKGEDLMEMSVSEQVPEGEEDVEVAVLENKLASDKLAEEF